MARGVPGTGRLSGPGGRLMALSAVLLLLGSSDVRLVPAGIALGIAYAAGARALPGRACTKRRGERRPDKNLILLAAGTVAVLALVLVVTALPGPAQPACGGRADGVSTYTGIEYCLKCHGPGGTGGDQHTGWRTTPHGADFSNRTIHGVDTNLLDRADGECLRCHVVGYNYTGIDGFDPALPYDAGNNSRLLGIQCEDCHGPGSDLCEDCHGPPIDHSHQATNMVENPTPEQSCAGWFAGAGCHGPGGVDVYTSWKSSPHSPADQKDSASPQGLNTYCAKCKSPSQYDPDTAWSGPVNISKHDWRGISCTDCHASHGSPYEGQLKAPAGELCGGCHNSGYEAAEPGKAPLHPQNEMFLGLLGANVSGTRGMPGTTCADCHGWNTPEVRPGLNLSDIAGYPYPLHEMHSFTPTPESCAGCHSDLLVTMPGGPRPAGNNGTDAALYAAWEGWMPGWQDEVERWNSTIKVWQSEVRELSGTVAPEVAAARAAISSAASNGTKDAAKIAAATSLWGDACWNLNLVLNDRSDGVHNHEYALALLRDALSKSRQALALMNANSPPVARAGPGRTALTNQELAFDGSGSSDIDGAVVSYHWDFGDGGVSDKILARHAYSDNGLFYVKLTVTDDRGAAASVMAEIFINNRAPRSFAGDDRAVAVNASVAFDASGSADDDGTIVGYTWDFGDGTSANGPYVDHRYPAPGVYMVMLVATDDDGAPGMDALAVTVLAPEGGPNLPPVARAGEDRTATVGARLVFDASGSFDPDGQVAGYSWTFGDGSAATGPVVEHGYSQPGAYAAVLTVFDDRGAASIGVVVVTVRTVEPLPADPAALRGQLVDLERDLAGIADSARALQNDTEETGSALSGTKRSLETTRWGIEAGFVAALAISVALATGLHLVNFRKAALVRRKLDALGAKRPRKGSKNAKDGHHGDATRRPGSGGGP